MAEHRRDATDALTAPPWLTVTQPHQRHGRVTLVPVGAPLIAGMLAVVVAGGALTVVAADQSVLGPATCCEAAERITPPSTLPASDRVVIFGDSLTWAVTSNQMLGSANTMQARLRDNGRSVLAVAEIGTSVPWGVRQVRANRSVVNQADVAVIGFGTNEVLDTPGLSVATSRAAIDRLVTALRVDNPDLRIMWSDVVALRLESRSANWNQALADVRDSDADFEICYWSFTALANLEWFGRDGVHLSADGIRARRDVLIDCVING